MNIALWIVQALLAPLFLFAGAMKFVMSVEEMTKQMPLPGWFLHFIGVCEVLGGLGLILPWLTQIRPGLPPIAATALAMIMVGATVITLMIMDITAALFPLIVGILAAFVAYGRWGLTPATNR